MHYKGKGVKQDDFKALKFYQHAFWKNLSALKSSCLTPLPSSYISPVLPKGV
jgi:hypothetical protein